MENPQPHLDDRRALWAVSETGLWSGSPFDTHLERIQAGSAERYEVGSRVSALWGTSPSNVWAVGEKILHWNGQNWATVAEPPELMMDVFGIAADSVWAVGFNGLLLHWNGCVWTRQDAGTANNLLQLWASAADDVWVIDNDLGVVGKGTLRHWDGSRWTEEQTGYLHSLWGAGRNDLWLGAIGPDLNTSLRHFDGKRWSEVDHPRGINGVYALWGTGSRDVYAGTHEGKVLAWDGSRWTEVFAVLDPNLSDVRLFQLSGYGHSVWATGDSGVLAGRTAGNWRRLAPLGDLDPATAGVGVSRDERYWAQGRRIYHRVAGETTSQVVSSPVSALARGGGQTWASAGSQVWVEDGGAWMQSHDAATDHPGVSLRDISASGADNVWSVGYAEDDYGQGVPLVIRFDGVAWRPVPVDRDVHVYSVLTLGPDDTWIGADSQVAHWNGYGWKWFGRVDFGEVRGLWGRSSRELFAAGTGGFRFDGSDWQRLPAPDESSFVATRAWGRSSSDVTFVGEYGEARQWNGRDWKKLALPVHDHLRAVFGAGSDTFILGDRGIILRKP